MYIGLGFLFGCKLYKVVWDGLDTSQSRNIGWVRVSLGSWGRSFCYLVKVAAIAGSTVIRHAIPREPGISRIATSSPAT